MVNRAGAATCRGFAGLISGRMADEGRPGMADGVSDRETEEHRRALVYPLEQSPAFGEAVEIAPG
jgi:hypothetical protein